MQAQKSDVFSRFTVRPLTLADYDELFALWASVPETKRALKSQDDGREGISRYLARNPAARYRNSNVSLKEIIEANCQKA